MKKILAILLACLLILSVACAENTMCGVMEAEGFYADPEKHDDEMHPGKYKRQTQ